MMKRVVVRTCCALRLVTVVGLVVACSSSGSSEDRCDIALGTYKTHYTVKGDAGPTCQAPPDGTTTVTRPGDGGTLPPDPDCTTTTNASTCTTTTACTIKSGGYTTVGQSTITTGNGNAASGTQSTKTTKDSDGSVLVDCTLDITWTKQ
jgi:hypothetical protein